MRVRALRQGFYRGSRRRPGVEFEMPEADKAIPKWVQPVSEPKKEIKSEEAKALAAAIASAGPKRAGVAAVRDEQGMAIDVGAALEEQAESLDASSEAVSHPVEDEVETEAEIAQSEDEKDLV